MTALRRLGAFGYFVAAVGRATVSGRTSGHRVIEEAYSIGVRALPILLVISFFVGTNLSLQGYAAFAPFGGQQLLGMFVALTGVRELGPIMVAAMVASKGGTEMASQLAVMRIREQIDALEVMAIDPYAHLVTPRLLGIVIVLPALTVLSVFTVVASAWLVAVYQLGESSHEFLRLVTATTSGRDLMVCAIKGALFGTLISTISCFFGFTSEPGPKGVGSATNASVVVSAVACALLNYLVSELAYG